MFIDFKDITNEVLIDARTIEEFNSMKAFQYNIPIIDSKTHKYIKKFYPCAIPVILYGLMKNRRKIKKELLLLSENGTKSIVIGCSRGRLRSPIMCLYAWHLGIDCRILHRGIKRLFK